MISRFFSCLSIAIAISVVTVMTASVASAAPPQSPPVVTPRVSAIFPYVVPESYLEHGVKQPDGLTRKLGHGLYIVLVHHLNDSGMVRNVLPEELKALDLTPEQAQHKADSNLGELIQNQVVKSSLFPNGPGGKLFAIFGGHWAAATSITWSGLHPILSKALNSEKLLICIPHRDAMLVFADGDEAYQAKIKALVKERESGSTKPLSMELFELTSKGVKAVGGD